MILNSCTTTYTAGTAAGDRMRSSDPQAKLANEVSKSWRFLVSENEKIHHFQTFPQSSHGATFEHSLAWETMGATFSSHLSDS